jgi:PAS domain S-box-containing protein
MELALAARRHRNSFFSALVIDPANLQESLLELVLRVCSVLGTVVYLPSVYGALRDGLYGVAVVDTVAVVTVIGLSLATGMHFRLRAAVLCLVMYGVGVGLLIGIGAISQIYLFGSSFITVLLFGLRLGCASVLLNAVTLLVIGALGHAAPEMALPRWNFGLAEWIIITLNFALVNSLLALGSGGVIAAVTGALAREVATRVSLERERTLLRTLIDALPDLVFTKDRAGKFVTCNAATLRLMGVEREEVAGKTVFDIWERDVAEPYHADDLEVMAGKTLRNREERSVDALGHPIWYLTIKVPLLDAAGAVVGLLGISRDITDRIAAEAAAGRAAEELRVSEERYRRIVESTTDGIWIYDSELVTTFFNGRMASMLGYTVEEAIGQSIFVFMEESTHAAARERVADRRRGIGGRGELAYRRKDGTTLWTSFQATPLFDAGGRFEAVLVVVTDESSERRADEMRGQMAAIVESSGDAILSVRPDGIITTWNAGAATLYQYAAAEMIGQSVFRLVPPAALAEERRLLEAVTRGEPAGPYDTTRTRKDGSVVEVAVTLSPVRDARDKVIGVSTIARDLTRQRQTEAALRQSEEQFRQAQRMEAVGRLAGGVAHDFNNLLSVILSYANMALGELKPGDPLRRDMAEISKASERASELTRQLLAFSRQQVLQPRVLDLAETVTAMDGMLQRLLGEDIELTVRPARDLGRVLADPGQIEQVVMNLAVNARDAMPEGGKLTIEMRNVELEATYVSAHLGASAGSFVMLAVSDTGAGMDAATRARIFEPFFTTKTIGKGTGLGLATVFGIVQQSGGHVGVYSEPGEGSTFKVYLPRTERSLEPRAREAAAVVGGSETILLVEDEDQVRTVACAILRRHGYRVLEAANGGEAFLVSQDFEGEIHLLLTDVVMPRMSGRKLAEQLSPQRPRMRVLFASGYTDDAVVRHGVLEEGVAFLQKPFKPNALLHKVREVLDAQPTSSS